MKGIKTTKYGSEEYKGITVFWDEDKDKRILDFINGLNKKDLSNLMAVQESKACLFLVTSGVFSLREDDEVEVGGDVWSVAELTNCKWDSYDDYLESDEWKETKADYHLFSEIASDVCFLCYEKRNLQLHHWRYPKNWINDSYNNLMQVCGDCHETIHSIDRSGDLHNSFTFDDSSMVNFAIYLSWLIKSTGVMNIARQEQLLKQFAE
tara:strand:+ start:625 stop:1248 length:624 start_codon:yes stop_codon:yes gene_type:complete